MRLKEWCGAPILMGPPIQFLHYKAITNDQFPEHPL